MGIPRRHGRRSALLAAGAAGALLLSGCSGTSGTGSTTPGEPAEAAARSNAARPSFRADTVEGASFDAATLQGRPAVLWFWAPWCTICRVEAASVLAVAQAHAGAVRVVGVAGRGDVADLRDFVADTGTGSLTHVVDEDGAVWRDFGVVAQPAFAFVSAEGEVEVFAGSLGEEALAEAVAALAMGSS